MSLTIKKGIRPEENTIEFSDLGGDVFFMYNNHLFYKRTRNTTKCVISRTY